MPVLYPLPLLWVYHGKTWKSMVFCGKNIYFFLMINFIYYYHQFFITKFGEHTYLLTSKMWKVCKPDFVDRYVQ